MPNTITDQYGNTFPAYRSAYDAWYHQQKASEAKDWRWLWDYLKKYPEKRTPETIPPFQDSTVQKPKLPKPAIPQPQTKVASLIKLAAAMQKTAVLSWNPLNWAKSEDEYRREQYDKERMAALQQFENNMNALDPGRAQRMEALRQRDAAINQRITANTQAAQERYALGLKPMTRPQTAPTTAVAAKPAGKRPVQAVPPPSAGTQRRQGYRTPDGKWHDITPSTSPSRVTNAEMGRVTPRQPPAKIPQTHSKMQPGPKGVTRSMYKQTV